MMHGREFDFYAMFTGWGEGGGCHLATYCDLGSLTMLDGVAED